MSTEIGTLKALRGDINLTQFLGPDQLMIQLTQGLGSQTTPGYIQLTRPEASMLVIQLTKWLTDTTKMSDY